MLDENAVPNRAPAVGVGKGKTIEQTYTKKTQLEHILLRPDTYGKSDPLSALVVLCPAFSCMI